MRKQRTRSSGTEEFEYVLSKYEYEKMQAEMKLLRERLGPDARTLSQLRAEIEWLRDTDKAIKFFGYEERLSEAQAEKDELRTELASLHADDELSSKNWKRIQADNLKYANENRTLRAELARVKPSWDDAHVSGGSIDWQARCERLADDVTILKTAYKKLFDEHKNCNAYVVFTDSQTVSREVD